MKDKGDIKEYLPFYLGCDVYFEKFNYWFVHELIIHNRDTKQLSASLLSHIIIHIDKITVKLKLRPLSDMTEDERKELWGMIFNRVFRDNGSTVFFDKATTSSEPRWVLSSGVERLGIELNGTVWADSDLHIWKHNQHEVTLWLLKKEFDLFGLIESGLAIDSTKITQP